MSFGTTFGSEGGSFPIMTILIAAFAVLLVGAIGRGLYVWMRNNRAPQVTVEARVTAKRMKVTVRVDSFDFITFA